MSRTKYASTLMLILQGVRLTRVAILSADWLVRPLLVTLLQQGGSRFTYFQLKLAEGYYPTLLTWLEILWEGGPPSAPCSNRVHEKHLQQLCAWKAFALANKNGLAYYTNLHVQSYFVFGHLNNSSSPWPSCWVFSVARIHSKFGAHLYRRLQQCGI